MVADLAALLNDAGHLFVVGDIPFGGFLGRLLGADAEGEQAGRERGDDAGGAKRESGHGVNYLLGLESDFLRPITQPCTAVWGTATARPASRSSRASFSSVLLGAARR